MSSDPESLQVLVSVSHEMEAAVIVDALADHAIRADAVGGFTAGFRAEAPGLVHVVVRDCELARAREVLAEISRERTDIDWSTVDVGDREPPVLRNEHPPFQFSTATVLILQTVVSVVLAVSKGYSAAVAGTFVVIGVAYLLILAGTIQIGADFERGRREWAFLAWALTVGFAVLALVALIQGVL